MLSLDSYAPQEHEVEDACFAHQATTSRRPVATPVFAVKALKRDCSPDIDEVHDFVSFGCGDHFLVL